MLCGVRLDVWPPAWLFLVWAGWFCVLALRFACMVVVFRFGDFAFGGGV